MRLEHLTGIHEGRIYEFLPIKQKATSAKTSQRKDWGLPSSRPPVEKITQTWKMARCTIFWPSNLKAIPWRDEAREGKSRFGSGDSCYPSSESDNDSQVVNDQATRSEPTECCYSRTDNSAELGADWAVIHDGDGDKIGEVPCTSSSPVQKKRNGSWSLGEDESLESRDNQAASEFAGYGETSEDLAKDDDTLYHVIGDGEIAAEIT